MPIYTLNLLQIAYEEDTASNTRETKNASTRGTATYTSSVFSGVPAGGACWVKQDFRATVTNYKVTSKSLLGSSYQTGVCVFQWSPNYSWFEGNLNVLSKGTFHAVVKGGPVSFAATFKAFFHTNKASLYQEFQWITANIAVTWSAMIIAESIWQRPNQAPGVAAGLQSTGWSSADRLDDASGEVPCR